jgi:hypothetical protein
MAIDNGFDNSSPKIPSYNPYDHKPIVGAASSGLFKTVDGKSIEIRDVCVTIRELDSYFSIRMKMKQCFRYTCFKSYVSY